MDKPDFSAMVHEVMTDQDYQNVNVRTVDLWLLFSACQAMHTWRGIHNPLRDTYKDIGKRLQAIIVTIHPNVKPLADAGWDRNYDYVFDPFLNTDDDDDDPSSDIPL